ncbi:RNA polymerase sigma factor RpoD/SigA [Neptuniibacter sp. CAU 1671]|uniref:sigma-70 family RNA polymerase sigma factor n=1 Tax=Neptuniibacter sp. CAU 1671 TaxID=3032593 RepID=UPI0023D98E99|nr:RNA polymerase sigma factor RpoD/SigA [Neptuniibacter sp. CAU 1671]MDF2182273.1 RNA polymerase sigma factor RpoD/SigA [Neptuniibacter sp. CAU 1671]
MLDNTFPPLNETISTSDLQPLTALSLYGQDVQRFPLLGEKKEAALGRQINAVMSQLIECLLGTESGLDQLEHLISDFLCNQLCADGAPAKRWDLAEPPQSVENQVITLIDTLKVIDHLDGLAEDHSIELRNTLIELTLKLNLSRQALIDIAQAESKRHSNLIPLYSRLMQRYSQLRAQLINSNLRLVFRVAAKYRELGIGFEDLLQDGNLGLIKAADRFNFAKGYRFSTYAHWCINTAVKNALQKRYHLIARPAHLQSKLSMIRNCEQKFQHQHSRLPSIEEIHTDTGIPINTLEAIQSFPETPISLSLPVHDSESLTLDMSLHDPEARADSQLNNDRQKRLLELLIKILTDREAKVLKMRFGIDCHTEHTLQEIANQLNISTERVRQLQHSALTKLQDQLKIQPPSHGAPHES